MYVDTISITTIMVVYVNYNHRQHRFQSCCQPAQSVFHLIQQCPNTMAKTPILIQGPVLFAVLEGVAVPDGPFVPAPVADGVAREVAVPSTPFRVAPPSAAACEADDTLYISSTPFVVAYA
jgi:hypothetical protein